MSKSLQLSTTNLENAKGKSSVYAITPSLPNQEMNAHIFNANEIEKFIQKYQYAPIIELKLGNYKDLIDNCDYFAIIFVSGKHETFSIKEAGLIDEAEQT